MILHLVTDRRRLAAGADETARVQCVVEQAHFAVSAGIDVIQVREPDMEGRALVNLTRALVNATRGSRTRVVVNDRLDVALAARADGVHLRGTSFDAARVRSCSRPGFLVGRSVRTPAEAAQAGPVDYLIAGTVFVSRSKPDLPELLGTAGLAEIVRATSIPVIGIGGIRPEHAGALGRCGAAGIAAIGAWMGDVETCGAVALDSVAEAFRSAFEAANMSPDAPPAR